MKRDIRPFKDSFNVLSKIQPVWYKWNGLWGHVVDEVEVVGVIAQQLEVVAPYAVVKIPDKLYKNGVQTEIADVETTPLIMLLVNAMVEMEERLQKIRRGRGK